MESPDVEKDFPGLYTLESTRKANESEYSDEDHEKSFKSELITKKKDKKESKKDRGYAALEGESSQDEGDSKSPSKSKKSKSFKFPVKKSDKRERDTKDKDVEKEKKRDKDKKEKSKSKERKKKTIDETNEVEEHAVFGVALEKSVERLGCLDGVGIPLPVRHCIDCIHMSGLSCDTLYKTAPVKAKIQVLKKTYNSREPVSCSDLDVPTASSLLLTFLRELPEHILTGELVARFEEAAATPDVAQREDKLDALLRQLPSCNRTLVSWIFVHLDHVTQHEELNKMNAQSIAMTFSPILQMSHRLLTAFLCHCKSLFTNTTIFKYIPPLPPGSIFPEQPSPLATELSKQEALLTQLHRDLSEGLMGKVREEQLWEVQRIVTQLKRKLKSLNKANVDAIQKTTQEEVTSRTNQKNGKSPNDNVENVSDETCDVADAVQVPTLLPEQLHERQDAEEAPQKAEDKQSCENTDTLQLSVSGESATSHGLTDSSFGPAILKLQLEINELDQWQGHLEERLDNERRLIVKYKEQIEAFRGFINSSEESSPSITPEYLNSDTEAMAHKLLEENQQLMSKRDELTRHIVEEKLACINLNVNIKYIELVQGCI